MAFLRLDDKYAEIEIVVFARQYANFSGVLHEDNAVFVEGTLSADEDGVKILLESASPLKSNQEYSYTKSNVAEAPLKRLYIRVDSMEDKRLTKLCRLTTLNSGETPIAIYDSSTGKYSTRKDLTINSSDSVLGRLADIFGPSNVILR